MRSDSPGKPGRRGWWQILVEAAAVVAVPSVLLYVLGVLAFWLRIASEYDGISIGTTWYAASLVPRSTAAASGIEVIAWGFMYGALASAMVLAISYVALYAKARKGDRGEGIKFFSAPLLIPFLFLLAAGLVLVTNLLLSGGSGYGLLFYLRFLAVLFLVLGFLAVNPLIRGTGNGTDPSRSPLRFYPSSVYRVIGAVLVVSMFASILTPREASLSCLWKEDPEGEVFEANVAGTQSEAESLQWTLQGGFLSKNGGTWYVLTEADRLQAIPDDEATRVVGGDFSVRYQEIGSEGTSTGEPVAEEDMKPQGTYVAVKHCSGFPSQPTITNLGGFTVTQTNVWVKERTEGK